MQQNRRCPRPSQGPSEDPSEAQLVAACNDYETQLENEALIAACDDYETHLVAACNDYEAQLEADSTEKDIPDLLQAQRWAIGLLKTLRANQNKEPRERVAKAINYMLREPVPPGVDTYWPERVAKAIDWQNQIARVDHVQLRGPQGQDL